MTTRARPSTVKDGLQEIRIDLAAALRLIHMLGLDDGIYNHISVRLPGEHDCFLTNPHGMRFEEVTASNLVTVDIDGNIIDDPLELGINLRGFTLHSAIHSARDDAICVLHSHAMAGVAVSALKEGLLPLTQWSLQFIGRLAYHDYEGVGLNPDERTRLVADLGDKSAMLLRHHGMITCGRSVAEAFKLMHNLERSCRAQLAIQASRAELSLVSQDVARHTARQYGKSYDSIELERTPDIEWAAFRRMLDRSYPDCES